MTKNDNTNKQISWLNRANYDKANDTNDYWSTSPSSKYRIDQLGGFLPLCHFRQVPSARMFPHIFSPVNQLLS